MTVAAIYTRVSSDKQREKNTIASQTTALIEFARSRGHHVPDEWMRLGFPFRCRVTPPSGLISGSCSSAPSFAAGFLPTPSRDDAVALG